MAVRLRWVRPVKLAYNRPATQGHRPNKTVYDVVARGNETIRMVGRHQFACLSVTFQLQEPTK